MPKWSERPLRNVIADDVRGRIIHGVYSPGSRIREEELAAEFNVSRVPVREALQLLEQQRFLVLRPRRGAIVEAPTPDGARELMEIRTELEALAARLAALARGGELLAELESVTAAGEAALEDANIEALPELVERFHDAVALASGNRELAELLRSIRRRVDWMFAVDIEARAPGSWSEHREIYDAIAGADPNGADRLMRSHVHSDRTTYDRMAPTESVDAE